MEYWDAAMPLICRIIIIILMIINIGAILEVQFENKKQTDILKKLIKGKQQKKIVIKKKQPSLFKASASKKRLVNPKAKNPFVKKSKKKNKIVNK